MTGTLAVSSLIMGIMAGTEYIGLTLILGLISVLSLIIFLKINAEMIQSKTGEEIAFIHLTTTLPIGLGLLCPGIGAILCLKVSILAFKGKFPKSGGTMKNEAQLHDVGKSNYSLGLLLIFLSIVAHTWWFLLIKHIYLNS